MLYPRCPTCGFNLASKQLKYEEDLLQINNNSKTMTEEEVNEKKMEVLNKYSKRYCCKLRLLTYVDTINLIK